MAKKNNSSFREDGVYSSSKDDRYDYVLRYIEEAIDSRGKVIDYAERAIRAYQGHPSHDGYLDSVNRYVDSYASDDEEKAERLRQACKNIKSRKNMTIHRAIDTMVNQAMGGVAQYECEPYDPHFLKDGEIVDKLNAAAKNFYIDNKIDSMLPVGIEYAGLTGAAYAYLEKKPGSDRDIDVTWVPSTDMLLDPIRLKRNAERYIGHQTKASFTELRKYLVEMPWTDEYALESINEVDTALQEVNYWISKVGGNMEAILPGTKQTLASYLDVFYDGSSVAWESRNTKFMNYGGSEGREDDKYITDEVEVSYVYDLVNNIKFTVVNRKFIVEAQKNYMTANIDCKTHSVDIYTGNVAPNVIPVPVHLNHPYVALEYHRSMWMNYAYSPIVDVLDIFDDICALESLIYHTISIMTPITFTGNPTDIEKLAQIAGVSGETIKGFIANSVTVLNKSVDLTPALSELQRLESTIKWMLCGPDASEQASIIGDRASGTEAALASGMVTQGLNTFLSNIEAFAGELAEKFFKMMLIYNGNDWEYSFPTTNGLAVLSSDELAGDLHFRAVLKNRIKVENRQTAQLTAQWFVSLLNSGKIPNESQMTSDVIPTLAENFTRKQVASWFRKPDDMIKDEQLQREYMQAEVERQEQEKMRAIDLGYVNPYGANAQFGTADVANALGALAPADMNPNDPVPYTGGRKPTPNARKLQYGISPQPDSTPMTGKPESLEASPAADVPQYLSSDSENALGMGTEDGGIMANDPITGNNTII